MNLVWAVLWLHLSPLPSALMQWMTCITLCSSTDWSKYELQTFVYSLIHTVFYPIPNPMHPLNLFFLYKYNSHLNYSNTLTMILGLPFSCGWNAHELTQNEEGHLLGRFCCSTTVYTGSCWLLHTLISGVNRRNGVSAFLKIINI